MNKCKVMMTLDEVKCALLDVEDGTLKMTPEMARENVNKINSVWDYILDYLK